MKVFIYNRLLKFVDSAVRLLNAYNSLRGKIYVQVDAVMMREHLYMIVTGDRQRPWRIKMINDRDICRIFYD